MSGMFADRLDLNWFPTRVLGQFGQLPQREFLSSFGNTMFLLVRVPDQGGPLCTALASTSTLAAETPGASGGDAGQMDFQTCFAADVSPDVLSDVWQHANDGDKEREQLQRLRDMQVFVTALRKRDGGGFLEKITIGRTRNHDVVLRDQSVSKFHASFQPRDDGSITVRDMGSKNKTRVNGAIIDEPTIVVPGDAVTFGSVETFVCSAAGLWATLNHS